MATKAKDEPGKPSVFEQLAMQFPAHCVDWLPKTVAKGRDGYRALALCYIDARSVMARLDEVVGPGGWQDSYRWEGNRTICSLALRIDGEWIAKEDGSGDSDIEAEKGGVSGAFKRAAVKWGIGRYLYDVDTVWADCEGYEKGTKNGKTIHGFRKWTRDGLDALAAALDVAPGPRNTELPVGVERVLEQIPECRDFAELRDLRSKHLPSIPVDYRAQVLRAFDARRDELDRAEQTKEPDDDRRGENEGDEN